jgi:hypothetical protein
MFIILKITTIDEIAEFIVYNKFSRSELARYSTYEEAFQDMLSRK